MKGPQRPWSSEYVHAFLAEAIYEFSWDLNHIQYLPRAGGFVDMASDSRIRSMSTVNAAV